MLYFNDEEVQKCTPQIGCLVILINMLSCHNISCYVGTVDDCNIAYNMQTVVKV